MYSIPYLLLVIVIIVVRHSGMLYWCVVRVL